MRAAAAIALLLSSAGAAASSEATGSLSGVVVDAVNQTPLAEAVVVARGPALLGEQSAVTDADGSFEMTLLPPGTYELMVKRDGFQTFAPAGLLLKAKKVRVRLLLMPYVAPLPPVETAVEFSDSMTPPAMLAGPNPEYSPDAIERGIQGVMQVRCIVAVSGVVRACKIVKGLPFMNGPVIDALQARKYRPALAQGKPVDVFYTFTVRLKLPQQ